MEALKSLLGFLFDFIFGTDPDAAAAVKAPARGVIGRRLGKVALGAICVALFGLIPLRTLMQNSSVEAVVNARIVTLRSPSRARW